MKYWIYVDGMQRGPMQLEELINMGIMPDTYIWRKGLEDWSKASDVPEVAGFFVKQDVGEVNTSAAPATNDSEQPAASDGAAETATQAPAEDARIDEDKKTEGETIDFSDVEAEKPVENNAEPKAATSAPVPPQPTSQPQPQPQPQWNRTTTTSSYYNPLPNNAPNHAPIPPCPPTNLVWAIIVTLMCCLVFGVIAIVFSAKVRSSYYAGDYDKAMKYSEYSEWMCKLGIVFGIVWSTLYMSIIPLFGI